MGIKKSNTFKQAKCCRDAKDRKKSIAFGE